MSAKYVWHGLMLFMSLTILSPRVQSLPRRSFTVARVSFQSPPMALPWKTTRRQQQHHHHQQQQLQQRQLLHHPSSQFHHANFPRMVVSLLEAVDANRDTNNQWHKRRQGDETNDDKSSQQQRQQQQQQQQLTKLQTKLSREFLGIAVPAFVQLAAEPLASLVDTAYLGRLGPEVLGGAGVAISAQYAVSKLYNDPLLRTSISLVAAQDGKLRKEQQQQQQQQQQQNQRDDDTTNKNDNNTITTNNNTNNDNKKNDLSVAVSSALLLALTVGLVQMVLFAAGARAITQGMGLTPSSAMWHPAVSYLRIRALGTPAATLWLVTNGVFRGLGDTSTPLVYALGFTALNALFDPLFIFVWKFGASGAAAGTALAQYMALVPLLAALHRRVPIDIIGQVRAMGQSLRSYLQAGALVLVRTIAKVLAYSVCARQVALIGPVEAAAYSLTFQLGFATTQLCEAIAVAVQTLLAREMADTSSHSPGVKAQLLQHLIRLSLWAGGSVAVTLSLTTWWQRGSIVRGLTTSPAVAQAALFIFPAVLLTQVLKGLAYPVNGILMGGLDWTFSMAAMWLANLACVAFIQRSPTMVSTLSSLGRLANIWWALAVFMGTQVVAGIVRYQSKTGVWKILRTQ